jgi:hypothetical protein
LWRAVEAQLDPPNATDYETLKDELLAIRQVVLYQTALGKS